jgi:hypothetical protein
MNFKLKVNRNYSYLFFVVIGLGFLTGFIFEAKIGVGVCFSCYALLGILQLYSGIALNKSGTALYKKDEHPMLFYLAILPYILIGTIGLLLSASIP